MRHILLTLLAVCLSVYGLHAQTQVETPPATPAVSGKLSRIYMFGCSVSFTDSVAYMTELQMLDPVHLQYNGFLINRTLYTVQLDNYVRTGCGCETPTTAIFFSKSKKKAEKKYLRVRRKQTERGIRITQLHPSSFIFQREDWVETITSEAEPTQEQ